MSIPKIDAWMQTVVRSLVEKGKRREQRWKAFDDLYGRMVETVTRELVRNVGEILKYWSSDAFIVV